MVLVSKHSANGVVWGTAHFTYILSLCKQQKYQANKVGPIKVLNLEGGGGGGVFNSVDNTVGLLNDNLQCCEWLHNN